MTSYGRRRLWASIVAIGALGLAGGATRADVRWADSPGFPLNVAIGYHGPAWSDSPVVGLNLTRVARASSDSSTFSVDVPVVVPVVTAVWASQRSGTLVVDVFFGLQTNDGAACDLTLEVSSNGGASYNVAAVNVTGCLFGMPPGPSLFIRWDAGLDWPGGYSSQMRVRVTARHPSGGRGAAVSPLFTLDTRAAGGGTLTGTLVRADTGTPVAGATVTLQPTGRFATSAGNGLFSISNVPPGTGYRVTATAAGYDALVVPNVWVTTGSNSLGTLVLQPASGTYTLSALSPDVNPPTTEVEVGGVAYRYYVVRRASDQGPAGGVAVTLRSLATQQLVPQTGDVRPGWAGATAGLSDGETGIVRLRIPASAVGNGAAGASSIFSVQIGSAPGPSFTVRVVPREYEHFWTQASRGGVHGRVNLIGGARVGGELGHALRVTHSFGAGQPTEELVRQVARRLAAGVELAPPVGGRAQFAGGAVGAYGAASAGAYVEMLTAYGYEFDPNSTDAASAGLRLYCAYAELADFVPIIGPFLALARQTLEPQLVDGVYRWAEGGLETGVNLRAEGTLGGRVGREFGIGAIADVELQGGVRTMARYWRLGDEWEAKLGWVGRASVDGGVGLGFRPYAGTGRPAAFRTIMENLGLYMSGSAAMNAEQYVTAWIPAGSSRPSAVGLTTRAGLEGPGVGTLLNWLGAGVQSGETGFVVDVSVKQPLTSADWQRMRTAWALLDLLAAQGTVTFNTAFGRDLGAALFPQQEYSQDKEFEVRVELVDPERVGVEVSGHVVLGGRANVNFDWEKGRAFPLMRGKLRGGRVYPQLVTAGAGVPVNNRTIGSLESEWFGEALPLLRQVLNWVQTILGGGRAEILATTPVGTARLTVGPEAWPVGTVVTSESWEVPAEQLPPGNGRLSYGTGGMYRFTADRNLQAPVTLTMSYLDAAVVGFDEADLRIYRFDDLTGNWLLLGGVVDPDANTVTTTVNTVGIFALGPPLPTGTVQFALSENVVPADGTTVVVAASVNLVLNTGEPVDAGWPFTVQAVGMEIVSPDADPTLPGVQVLTDENGLGLVFRAPASGGVGAFTVRSVYGTATGQGTIAFEDDLPPPAVTGVVATPGETRVTLRWNEDGMPADLASYRVYYRAGQAGPPFDGTAGVEGQPSPVTVSSPECVLRGLTLGQTYFVAVAAVDLSGNEGPLSGVVGVATVAGPPSPPTTVRAAAEGDNRFLITWDLSEDDGFNDRDVDHYDVYREILPSGEVVLVAAVPAGRSLCTDTYALPADATAVRYAVAAVDADGLASEAADAAAAALCRGDLNCDGIVDFDDIDRFVEALNHVGGEGWPHADCPWLNGDCDGNGNVDFDDIDPFVARIGASCE